MAREDYGRCTNSYRDASAEADAAFHLGGLVLKLKFL